MSVNHQPTVNELPVEMIASFAPDLRPATVSTLRLVNRRFRDVFSRDYYYRYYLRFLDKPHIYERDLKKIGDVENKWKLCLELEKKRFHNWRKGTPLSVETVRLPEGAKQRSPAFGGFLKGLIDRDHEYWVLIQCYDNKIALMNYSEKAVAVVHDMGQYGVQLLHETLAEIATGQFFVAFESKFFVFKYAMEDDAITLTLHFQIEGSRKKTLMMSKVPRGVQGQTKNILLNYDEFHVDRILRLWNCSDAKEMDSISLKEFESMREKLTSETCSMRLTKGAYPDVFIVAVETADLTLGSRISKFNIETKQLIQLFERVENLTHYSFNAKYACLLIRDESRYTQDALKVYDHRVLCTRRPVQPRVVCQVQLSIYTLIQFIRLAETILLVSYRERLYGVTHLDGSEIVQRKNKISCRLFEKCSRASTVIGPFWLVHTIDNDISYTFDEKGDFLFDWNNITEQFKWSDEVHGIELPKHYEHMQNISKILLCNGDGGLEIVNF